MHTATLEAPRTVERPAKLIEYIRAGRWSEQQIRHAGVIIVEFVLTLPMTEKRRAACTKILHLLPSGSAAELRAAAAYAADAAAYAADAYTADAAYAAAAAAYAADAAAYADAAAADAAAAYAAAAAAATRRVRHDTIEPYNNMIAQLSLLFG